MNNIMIYIVGFSLIFLLFIYIVGQYSLSEKPSNSNASRVLSNDVNQTYHEWDEIIPISLTTQNISLGTFFKSESNVQPLGLQFIKQKQENKGGNNDDDKGKESNKGKESGDSNQKKNEKKVKGQEKKIEKRAEESQKLKDKQLNDEDNQRLIEQRNEFDEDEELNTFDGYGFNGGTDNGVGNFNFAAVGDFGCSENTQSTVGNIQRHEPELVLAVGDMSYHSTADCWFDVMMPLKGKFMITLGHHDVEDGQAKMNQYLKSFGLEKPFYSYDYNNVHFLIMSANSVFYKGSEQYNFVLQDLKKASEKEDVNWIIVSTYGPLYTSPSKHPAYIALRDIYHPIFEKYGVDLVLSGHNHNYQRTYPITFNPDNSSKPVVTNAVTTGYNSQRDGIVFAIVGTGGVNFYSFDGQAPFVGKQFADKFGYLNIDISNGNPHTKLTGTFYGNHVGEILDQFTIEKEIKNKNGNDLRNYPIFG
jgi:Calcineurin-like phosphoesterase